MINNSLFNSLWRPFIGWICALSLFYNFILRDFVIYFLNIENAPCLNLSHLISLIVSLLGISTLRTYEKTKIK